MGNLGLFMLIVVIIGCGLVIGVVSVHIVDSNVDSNVNSNVNAITRRVDRHPQSSSQKLAMNLTKT